MTTQNVPFEQQNFLSPQSIPERFETIVARQPDRLAVKFEKLSFSYRELNEASNRIAHALLAFQYPERSPVALLFGRGINVIVALIGALKADKQVHTLDPQAPEERMKAALRNCRTILIVTDSEFLALHDQLDAVFAASWLWQPGLVRHVHLKDYDGNPFPAGGRRYLHLGEGQIDFGRLLRQLREVGFDGALSLEARAIDSEGRVDVAGIQASLQLIAQLAG